MSKLPKDWSPNDRKRFDQMKKYFTDNQTLFNAHPDAPLLSEKHWNTVVHNMSWFAVDFYRGQFDE